MVKISEVYTERLNETSLPTKWGEFKVVAYLNRKDENMPHLAIVSKNFDPSKPVTMRIHSECMTGDIFGSSRCDCGDQLATALRTINEEGGVVLYMRQEGRGIGLLNKIEAYNLQDKGYNTVEANTMQGLEEDARRYDEAIFMLNDLGISEVNLMTNNPLKIKALEESNIIVNKRVPIQIEAIPENYNYLKTKKDLMGHLLK